jgi:predicted ATPase
MDDALVRAVELRPPAAGETRTGYPWDLPVVRGLADGLALDPAVTYLIGENGSGKSTVLEGLAVAAGMNPEGGSSNFTFSTRESHSGLWEAIRLIRGARRPRTDFFLRAESLFTAATYVEELGEPALTSYGGRSLHEQSHGEAFLAGFLDSPQAFLRALLEISAPTLGDLHAQ